MKISTLIEKIDWFQKFAQENLDTAIETKDLSPQERNKIYRQRYLAKLKELGQQNPSDPRWQKYVADQKSKYQLEQEYLDSNPEELQKYLDNQKERTRRFTERNQELVKQRRADRAKLEAVQVRNLKEGGTLDGLLLILGQQVAARKKDLKKYNKLVELESFSKIATLVSNLRFHIREYLHGMNEAPGTPYAAKKEQLFKIIEDAQIQHDILSKISPAMTRTAAQIIIKLQELADNFTASS